MINELSERSKAIFRQIVDACVASGEPVGSRAISRLPEQTLSPASIRNVMADLEEAGLLYAPHTSAGRLPTDQGLRLYVDGLLEKGNVTEDDRSEIDGQCAGAGRSIENVLSDASSVLSGLSRYAGLVLAPKSERPFRQVEFVPLSPGRALVVVVTDNGMVENRVIDLPLEVDVAAMTEASNYLTARLAGRSLADAAMRIEQEMTANQGELDHLTRRVVQAGLATWAGDPAQDEGVLIVRGQANLLDDVATLGDLERIRSLFQLLETKRTLLKLIDRVRTADGVQIFIGAENQLFGMSGCSMIVAPYAAGDHHAEHGGQVVGAIGVIGPTRMNYARIIPMVDYTARVVSRMLGGPDQDVDALKKS
jgi:heat-inducible transcriptional repressor